MLRVVVKTFDLATGKEVNSRAMKLTDENRDWLLRNLTWALNHGMGLQVYNVDDEAKLKGQ
jgi:hypothetical protein